ncbi:hypothetical protein [Actinocrinis sp.]|uniref:hypothetical protein n=1 Tax=Actinocrinis sp. TaxID=1920516 RepID=UPI002BF29B0C|nr:hypothetical protein [Actinocrinis sp.]HXR71852.1 hypothetical protein [Actinocrinis sp.]
MPTSTRRTDGTSRRALVAVATPIALAAVAGALTLAAPANAAGTSSALPFPTSVCSTNSPASTSPSASASRSATATPQASASASGSTKANTTKNTGTSASPSASASASNSAAAGSAAAPTPTPSASTTSSGGFWGWLNGVWTWIFGSQQLPKAGAAPVMGAAFNKSSGTVGGAASSVVSVVRQGAAKVGSSTGGTKTVTHSGAVKQAATGAGAQATPSPTGSCLPQSQIKANTATSDGNTAANLPWHLSSPSMTMYSLTYNGVTTIQTVDGPEQVLDFTAAKVTLLSMITYSQQGGGKIQYVDGGKGQTVTLENVHLWSTSFTADVLGLIHQTFTPANPGLLTVLRGITIPLPLLFTNVEADNAFLNTGTIAIPGFDGHGN